MRRKIELPSKQSVLEFLNTLCPFIQFIDDEYEGVECSQSGAIVSQVLANWPAASGQQLDRGFWVDWVSNSCTVLLDQGAAQIGMSDTYIGHAVSSSRSGDMLIADGRGMPQNSFHKSQGSSINDDLEVAVKYTSCFFSIHCGSPSSYTVWFEALHLASALSGQVGLHVTVAGGGVTKSRLIAGQGPGIYGLIDPAPFITINDYGSDEIYLLLEDGWSQASGIALNSKPVQSESGFSFAGALLYEDGVCDQIDADGKLILKLNVGVNNLLPQSYSYPCYLADTMQVDVDGESTTTVILKDAEGTSYAFPLTATQELQEKLNGAGRIDLSQRMVINTPANASITNRPVSELIADGTLSGEFIDTLLAMVNH